MLLCEGEVSKMKKATGFKCPKCGEVSDYYKVETTKIFYPNGYDELYDGHIELEDCCCVIYCEEFSGDTPAEYMLGFTIYEEIKDEQ